MSTHASISHDHAAALALAESLRRVVQATATALPDLAPFDAPKAVHECWLALDAAEAVLRHYGLDAYTRSLRARVSACKRCRRLGELAQIERDMQTCEPEEEEGLEAAADEAREAAEQSAGCPACGEGA